MASIFADDPAPEAPGAPVSAASAGPSAPSDPAAPLRERGRSNSDPGLDGLDDAAGPSEPSFVRLPSRIRALFTGGVKTAGDAYEVCHLLLEEQLQKAAEQRPLPNAPIPGDASARSAFLLLLSDTQQRQLFLSFASRRVAWPRLRPLIGAPPYHFLMPQDAGVLNAAGFARGRTNMTYDTAGRVANRNQFGPGQLVDQHTREYRVAPRDQSSSDPLPGLEYFQARARDLLLQVRVRTVHGISKKRELYNSSLRQQLLFPQPGETIVLQETERLLNARGLRQPSRTELKVKALFPRSQHGNTAAVLVSL